MKLTLCAICALGMMVINIGCTTQGERVAASGPVTIPSVSPERFKDFSIAIATSDLQRRFSLKK